MDDGKGNEGFERCVRWAGLPHGAGLFQFFGLVVGDERLDDGLEVAVHHLSQVVESEADAMIGDAILGKIVGPDLFASVS